MPTNIVGHSPYTNSDDSRRWAEQYRVNKMIKPTLVLRSAAESNYINDQFIQLPAYKNRKAFARSMCNILSPGQRLGGVLQWSVTESIDNLINTAQLTVLDALPVSKVNTTITGFAVGTKGQTITSVSSMPAQWHSTTIRYNCVQNADGIAIQLGPGNSPISSYTDPVLVKHHNPYTTKYQEDRLLYRIFEPEIIEVQSLAAFPDPSIPASEAEQGGWEWWESDTFGLAQGIGAYFVLVGNEVMRVTRIDRGNPNRIFVIPGGRGVAGGITTHHTGETVTLLGHPPFTGTWTGFGYLMPTDYQINLSPMRPGSCWASYEGYGVPGSYRGPMPANNNTITTGTPGLTKTFIRNNNTCFTGYWFTQSPEVTLDNSGVPQLTCSFQSSGYVLADQQISLDTITRAKNVYGSWAKSAFDQIGYDRKMPGDWYDFTSWDPSKPGSYPLTISTEYAQHKAFFDHMTSTDFGRQCEFCQQEWMDYVLNHEHGKPTGSIAEARAVGKHIYQESIRVYNLTGQTGAGPLKTFGRLMNKLAIAAWDNPLEGNPLASRFSKIPNRLHDNLINFANGRCWNGALAYDTVSSTKGYDWSNVGHEDFWVHGNRHPLKSPFTSQYDRQPWSQPMQDLSDLNRMQYYISREGYPVFVPIGRKMRGMPSPLLRSLPGSGHIPTPASTFVDKNGNETADFDQGRGEWHLAYGASIDSYTHTIDPSTVLTLVYVSCQTAFSGSDEISFTIPAAGTGQVLQTDKNQNSPYKVVQYSWKVGNKEGLQYTGGSQVTDAVSVDNFFMGLDWNTHPASWGLQVKRDANNLTQVDSQPPMPEPGGLSLYLESKDSKTEKGKRKTKLIQKLINFMMERRYIGPAVYDDNGAIVYPLQIQETGKFDKATSSGVKNLQQFLTNVPDLQGKFTLNGGKYFFLGGGSGIPYAGDKPGVYGKSTYKGVSYWFGLNKEFLKTDVWWYVQNGLPWDQYIAAITGLYIPQTRDTNAGSGKFAIDQQALKTEAQEWMKQFFKDAINYGNAIVDDSINKSSQKSLNTNLADPRIQLGDVVWATIPGYMAPQNSFLEYVSPFLNGVYLTSITRTMDLQAGSYTGTYSGYRYRGSFDQSVMTNASNYCSIHTGV